jgi:spore maturation protein CgeB
MKIFLVGEFWSGSLCRFYLNAFRKLNCKVKIFDQNEFLTKNKYIRRVLSIYLIKRLNYKVLTEINSFNPHMVLFFKGQYILPKTLKRIKEEVKAVLFNIYTDNPFNITPGTSSEYVKKSISYYHCYFIWGKFLIPKLFKAGAKLVKYLPFAYASYIHYPVQPDSKYKNDIAFIGTWDEEREKWLGYLKNYDLAIWGNSWEKVRVSSALYKKWRHKPAIGEEFSKVCNSSKIILNFIRKQNGDAHNMRTFEIPACQGFMLTQRTKEQSEFFVEDKEIVCFSTYKELISKINFYLNHPELREKIRKNGFRKVKKQTYLERAKDVLKVYRDIVST